MLFDEERLQWREEYAVGVPLIDEEHQRLFEMLRELHGMLSGELNEANTHNFIRMLLEYTTSHLAEEEEAMLRVGYPGYLPHKAEHERFLNLVQDFSHEMEKDPKAQRTLCLDMITSLSDWFSHHFLRMDRETVPHLKFS